MKDSLELQHAQPCRLGLHLQALQKILVLPSILQPGFGQPPSRPGHLMPAVLHWHFKCSVAARPLLGAPFWDDAAGAAFGFCLDTQALAAPELALALALRFCAGMNLVRLGLCADTGGGATCNSTFAIPAFSISTLGPGAGNNTNCRRGGRCQPPLLSEAKAGFGIAWGWLRAYGKWLQRCARRAVDLALEPQGLMCLPGCADRFADQSVHSLTAASTQVHICTMWHGPPTSSAKRRLNVAWAAPSHAKGSVRKMLARFAMLTPRFAKIPTVCLNSQMRTSRVGQETPSFRPLIGDDRLVAT